MNFRSSSIAPRRRGMIFVIAMWTILVLAALVLIFARDMQVEVTASANRVSTDQSATLELGAEQYVLAAVDASEGDAVTVMQTPAEGIQIPGTRDPATGSVSGDGYFWIMQSYPDSDTPPAIGAGCFGITDESSKLNLNVATSPQLALLPQMTQAISDSIVLWRGGASTSTSGQGADSSYYQTGARPYSAKAAKFESVDELYLIRDMTDSILYGYDMDHNGVLDQNEQNSGGLASSFNGVNGTGRGIAPFLTAWSQEPNTDSTGKARINISMLTNATQLRTALTKDLPAARVSQILERAMAARTFKSIFDFAAKTGMKQSELELVADSLTTSGATTLPGLVNVNTASMQVLLCLPGLTSADAQAIVTERASNATGATSGAGTLTTGATGNTNTDFTWLMNVSALTPAKLAAIGGSITGRSFFFSADIVAVSGNGRSFKRARIVVDARKSPPVIVYRKDLTYLGWPLDPQILVSLKSNAGLPQATGYGTGGANGITQTQ